MITGVIFHLVHHKGGVWQTPKKQYRPEYWTQRAVLTVEGILLAWFGSTLKGKVTPSQPKIIPTDQLYAVKRSFNPEGSCFLLEGNDPHPQGNV